MVGGFQLYCRCDLSCELHGLGYLSDLAYLDLYLLACLAALHSTLYGLRQSASECDVVPLDQDSVFEVLPVVHAPATTDSVFVQQTQAGNGLACVQHLGLGTACSFYELTGQCGDTAHALHQVQDDAFAAQNRSSVVADNRDDLSALYTDA